jgi:hypothetical protein
MQAVVRCLLGREVPTTGTAPESTRLFLDISASMGGFLDAEYSSEAHDFRRLLDTLVLRLSPSKVYGYGSELRSLDPSVGSLGKPGLFAERDTRMELVFTKIAEDSLARSTHLILGDARRGTPDAARRQFGEMSAVARGWIEHGGVFVVGVTMAPFHSVPIDPSGCKKIQYPRSRANETEEGKVGKDQELERHEASEDDEKSRQQQRCPLYLFAFVSAGDRDRVAPLVLAAMEHSFVWPVPQVLPTEIEVAERPNVGAGPRAQFEQRWIRLPDQTSVARLRSDSAMRSFVPLRLVAAGTDLQQRAMNDAMLNQARYHLSVDLASLEQIRGGNSVRLDWRPAEGKRDASLVKIDPTQPTNVAARALGGEAKPMLVRLTARHVPSPLWLEDFVASSIRDPVRTGFLDLLFIGLPDLNQSQRPIAYLLIN